MISLGICHYQHQSQFGFLFQERPVFLHTCATCSELPFNISTMNKWFGPTRNIKGVSILFNDTIIENFFVEKVLHVKDILSLKSPSNQRCESGSVLIRIRSYSLFKVLISDRIFTRIRKPDYSRYKIHYQYFWTKVMIKLDYL